MLDVILQFTVATALGVGSFFLITEAKKLQCAKPGVGIVMIVLGVLCMLCCGLLLCHTLSNILPNTTPVCPECNSNTGSSGYNFCPWCGISLE